MSVLLSVGVRIGRSEFLSTPVLISSALSTSNTGRSPESKSMIYKSWVQSPGQKLTGLSHFTIEIFKSCRREEIKVKPPLEALNKWLSAARHRQEAASGRNWAGLRALQRGAKVTDRKDVEEDDYGSQSHIEIW